MSEHQPGQPVIRDAIGADAAALLAAAIELTDEAGGGVVAVRMTAEQLRLDLEAGVACALVAEDAGDLVAIAFFSFVHHSLSGQHLYLDDLFVVPTHRNGGLGRRLMAALADRAVGRGCVGMTWQVEHDNRAGIRFYERLGARMLPDRRVMNLHQLGRLAGG